MSHQIGKINLSYMDDLNHPKVVQKKNDSIKTMHIENTFNLHENKSMIQLIKFVIIGLMSSYMANGQL